MWLDGAPVSRPYAAIVLRHLQHLAAQLMPDDAWKGVIGLVPFKGVPIAAADHDAVNPHQGLAGLPDHGRHNVSREFSGRFQYDLSHSFSNFRV
jgi:hypothetical protein